MSRDLPEKYKKNRMRLAEKMKIHRRKVTSVKGSLLSKIPAVIAISVTFDWQDFRQLLFCIIFLHQVQKTAGLRKNVENI